MPLSKKGKSLRMASTSYGADDVISDLNVDIVTLHGDPVGPGRDHGGQAGDGARLQVEARAVGGALDVEAPKLTLAQRVLLVGTDVAQGVVASIFGVRETDLLAVQNDLPHRVHGQVVYFAHQVLGHQPIRASSSCSTRSRACCTGIRSST